MTIYEMVVSDYREFIQMDSSVPDELRRSLKVNERSPVFIDRLVREITHIEKTKPNIKLDRMKIKMLIYDLTKMYVHLLKTQVDQMQMSASARSQTEKDLLGDPLLSKLDKHGNGDFTEELGVIIKDKVN